MGFRGIIKKKTLLNSINTKALTISRFLPNPDAINEIISVHENLFNDSIIWFGTTVGLLEFNRYTKSTKWYYFPQKNKIDEVALNTFRRIYQHDDGLLYVGGWDGGGKVFEPKNKTLKKLPLIGKPSAFVAYRYFIRKSENEIWITASGGLECYNTETQKITFSIKNRNKAFKFYGADCIDDNGRFWTISHNGVYFYDPVLQQFSNFSFSHLNADLWGFARDVISPEGSNIITVCPQTATALYHYNRETRDWSATPIPQKYLSKDQSGFSGRQMRKSPFGDYTINYVNGLFTFDAQNDQIVDFSFKPKLEYNSIRSTLWDSKGQYWIGTWRDGLICWNSKTNEVRNFYNDLNASGKEYIATTIEALFEDSKNNNLDKTQPGHQYLSF